MLQSLDLSATVGNSFHGLSKEFPYVRAPARPRGALTDGQISWRMDGSTDDRDYDPLTLHL